MRGASSSALLKGYYFLRSLQAAQRLIEPNNDELTVIRLARADVTPDAKGEVVVVQDTDVLAIEDHDVLDGDKEWKIPKQINGRSSPANILI